MRTAILCGREHTRLGAISAISEGRCAIALSRGGARKTYSHTDPNEDSAGFAEAEGGILVVVADGHSGHQAAEIAVQRLLEDGATAWLGPEPLKLRSSWQDEVADTVAELNAAILDHVARGGPEASRTTLAFALIRPQENLLAWASIGDSHVFHVGRSDATDVAFDAARRSFYLGFPAETRESLRERCVVGCEELGDTRAVVLATDGLSEQGIGVDNPEGSVARVAAASARTGSPAHAAVTAVCERALEAHRSHRAGDNVASAVIWLGARD